MSRLKLGYQKPAQTNSKKQQPYSQEFADVYFNDEGGLAETQYVFIQHNQLIKRWNDAEPSSIFCIGETGFGTGLNFLAVCQAWQQCKNKPQQLHFVSFEKHPLPRSSLEQVHKCFPELSSFSQSLQTIWGNFRTGFHHFEFPDNIKLTLAFGDATTYLKQLEARVDAWFLDGFAPKKNPDMWCDALFYELNRLSTKTTTAATYTAASQVRKSLENHGFKVIKKPGFGKKREMITAHYSHGLTHGTAIDWHPTTPADTHHRQATIIGAGVAGMCLAKHLKEAGFSTTVIEQNQHAMTAASGNAAAMMMPMLTAKTSPESLFYLRAFEYALRFYQPNEFFSVGVTEHLNNSKQLQWAKTLAAADLPADLINFTDTQAHYQQAGFLQPHTLAQRLQASVDNWLTAEVAQVESDQSGQWLLQDPTGKVIKRCELLIIANGIQAQQLLKNNDLSLTAKHGQTSVLKTQQPPDFKSIQLDRGYLIPINDGQHLVCGATFDPIDQRLACQSATLHPDHGKRNMALWRHHRRYKELQQLTVIGGHAAVRATTPDHLPLCGPLIDQQQFCQDYSDLHHGRHWQTYPPAQPLKNLYLLNGLGSRGFTSAPLLACYLTAMISGQPLPLERDLCKIIHPNRFLYRQLKKPPEKLTQ